MNNTSSDLWDTLMNIGDQMEASRKKEQAAKQAAEAEAARKAPRTIARYLTVAGSTLGREDLSVALAYASSTGWITATCAGCTTIERTSTNGLIYDTPEEEQARIDEALPSARRWAQDHAERCRAIPTTPAA